MERLKGALEVIELIVVIDVLFHILGVSHQMVPSGVEIITGARKHADLSSVDITGFRGDNSRKHTHAMHPVLFSSESILRTLVILATRRSLHTWAGSGGGRGRVIVADLCILR